MARRPSPLYFGRPDVDRFTCRPEFPQEADERRGSAASRGYDAAWSRLAARHRRLEPLCRECLFRGRRVVADLVNHTVPVRDAPELRLDPGNLSSMCKSHHDTVIRQLEAEARKSGDIFVLVDWLRDPSTRPPGLAFTALLVPSFLRKDPSS